ncbi:putative bifunctional diguanylate cyclase/phosphodiesterase [Vreelandella aquamarina]
MRFRTRLMLVLLAVVVVSQLATGMAFLRATQNDAQAKGSQRLEVGARVLHQLLDIRGDQLRNNVAILADDFGFKSAVATQDTSTLYSVLANYGDRADADMVMLTDLSGNILASSHHSPSDPMPFAELFQGAQQSGSGVSVVINDGEPYEFVLLPVRAPNLIGWVGMGFLIDEDLTNEIHALTGLDVSIVTYSSNGDIDYLASSHQETLARRLMASHSKTLMDGTDITRPQMSDNNTYLSYALPLLADAQYQTLALLQLSQKELLSAYHHLQWQLLGIVGLILLATVVVAVWSARSISKPLIALAQLAQRIGKGEYVRRTYEGSAFSETELMANTLFSMQDDIARREATLLHQSRHDLLTDLPNRISALEDVQQYIIHRQPFTLLRFTINDFRNINDTFGYEFGDHLLTAIARRIQTLHSSGITGYRLDGNELMLLIHQEQYDANKRAQLMGKLSEPVELKKSMIVPSLSTGEVTYPTHGESAQLLLRRSDIALDQARQHHRSHACYMEGQDEHHLRQLMLIRDLNEAISNNELWMAYQPKVDTRTGNVSQFEALMRWRHPTLGFVPPDEFIGLAERSGNIGRLTRWMLVHVCQQISEWKNAGYSISVAVNLSASDVINAGMPCKVSEILGHYDLSPKLLSLEVTESAVMQDVEAATKNLLELSQLGLKIAIDDYGTGYSSLAQIRRLPVDELKIDKSFVLNLDTQEEDFTIVRSTIEMGHNLGLTIVAEGVESIASAKLLDTLDCDYLQGYWISRPMPGNEVLGWLDAFTLLVESPPDHQKAKS